MSSRKYQHVPVFEMVCGSFCLLCLLAVLVISLNDDTTVPRAPAAQVQPAAPPAQVIPTDVVTLSDNDTRDGSLAQPHLGRASYMEVVDGQGFAHHRVLECIMASNSHGRTQNCNWDHPVKEWTDPVK